MAASKNSSHKFYTPYKTPGLKVMPITPYCYSTDISR